MTYVDPMSIDMSSWPDFSFLTSARTIVEDALRPYGLQSLADTVWGWQTSGYPPEQIQALIRQTPEYAQRFPAMKALQQKGRAITEAQYINLENTYTQLARQYGLPQGFYDQPDDFAKLIGGEVSPQEFQTRLQDYQTLAFDTDPTARGELQRLYGIGAGDIAAYLIDPARALPLLQRQVGAAEVSAQATRSGFGGLTQAEGELLSNVTPDQATQGFGQLVNLREVLGQLPGEADVGVGRDQALGAVFRGDALAQQEIEARQRRRLATFQEGGQYEASQKGFSGVGAG